ncbi:DNA-binding protein [Candidatus Omnitrophota bacterium]
MKRVQSLLILPTIISCAVFLVSTNCHAQSVSSVELIGDAAAFDGKEVVYEGEVIGDIMKRGDHAWVNVRDGQASIGIWVARHLLKDVRFAGGYKAKGDRVEVRGEFHRACPEHGGDLDIHAKMLRKVSPGRLLQEKVNSSKRRFVFILLGVLCAVLILRFLKLK